jgi:SAM-dependent methyltransferase
VTNDAPQGLPADSVASTLRFYDLHAMDYFKKTVQIDVSHLYPRFLARVKPEGRILDVGCGSGRDARAFVDRHFKVVGIDASAAMVHLAREYSGAECSVLRMEDVAFEHIFDGIWACASLLHLPKPVLNPVLRRLRRALVPTGTLYASVLLGEGEALAADGRYYTYFQLDEFSMIVEDAGFRIDDVWFSDALRSERLAARWINVVASVAE